MDRLELKRISDTSFKLPNPRPQSFIIFINNESSFNHTIYSDRIEYPFKLKSTDTVSIIF